MLRKRRLGHGARQAIWGVLDQAISSLTNFGLTVFAAHSLGASGFGLFGVLFATYLIFLGISRAVCSEPLAIRFTNVPAETWRLATAESAGTAILMGCIAGLACVLVSLGLSGPAAGPLLAFGVAMPFLLTQDAWRNALFAAGRGAAGCINDLAWGVGQTIAIVLAYAAFTPTTVAFVLAWGFGAGMGAMLGSYQAHVLPRPRSVMRWIRSNKDLNGRYVLEFFARSVGNAGTIIATGAIAGLPAAAALRAAQVVMTPITITTMGLTIFGIPQAVRELGVSTARMLRFCAVMTVILVSGALVWAGAASLVPGSLGRLLLGHQWALGVAVIVPYGVAWAGTGAITGATIGLRALAAARTSLRLRLWTGALTFGAGTAGAIAGGAYGAAVGLAIASVGCAPFWWAQLRRSARVTPPKPQFHPDDSRLSVS